MTYEEALTRAGEWEQAAREAKSPVLKAALQNLALEYVRLASAIHPSEPKHAEFKHTEFKASEPEANKESNTAKALKH